MMRGHMAQGTKVMTPRYTGLLLLLAFAQTDILFGQGSAWATQRVTLEVRPMALFAVSGDPQPLTVYTAVAGKAPDPAFDRSTSYSIVTTTNGMKISAFLSERLPTGTRLLVTLATSSGTTVGDVDLSAGQVPVDLVRDIAAGADARQAITYTYLVDAGIGEIQPRSYQVTFTLSD